MTPLGDTFTAELAQFGPTEFDLQATLVLAEDTGDKSPTDACQAIVNNVAGKIVLVDRGDCTFETKVTFAQAAGAVGVVIADNVDAATPPALGNDGTLADPTIPAQGVTKATGALLKAALENGAQTAHMVGATSVERDGTIDNMIVAHEWGHYIHHRLVECGNNACAAQSEGWGDFVAVHMMLREGDPLGAVYAADTYASFDLTGYFGIRRVPYSVDFTKNALTYRHIADGEMLPDDHPIESGGISNSEVHNAGEVWATMMWEAYIALHEAHQGQESFAEIRRLFADYVVAGMILAPPSPTFTEQRDALLMAAAARSNADFTTIAEAFARRGAGSCAVSPPKNSVDFKGVVEDFQLRANGVLLTATIGEGDASCDGDGVIDIGEDGRIDLEFYNGGAALLPPGSKIEVIDPDPALVFPNGSVVTMPELAPLAKTTASIEIAVAGLTDYRPVDVKLRVTTIDSCNEVSERVLPIFIHADLAANVSAVDDVEAEPSVWKLTGGGESVWRRAASEQDGFYWHADDVGRQSDTRLNSPALIVAEDAPLRVAFDHAFSFETSDGINWDGAVIELTRDA
ncbi:MAG TPA: M36 family metallopeptidase, partial [Nannocystis sp.]